MRGSLRIGTFFGIGVFIHWSFVLILVIVAWAWAYPVLRETGFNADGLSRAVRPFFFGLGFILSLFLCVTLHEYGHALTARRYGVNTRDITLYPIGGVARLERIPERPGQEVAIAIAGPMVNVVIAAILWVATLFMDMSQAMLPTAAGIPVALTVEGFVALLLWANVILVAFNLLPAFPMDGGRVLRALLAYRLDYATATRIAAGVGQLMAGVFLILGVLWNPWLIIIAVFVYLAAQAEAQMAEFRGGLSGLPVRDAMITKFLTLSPEDTLERASEALLAGTQQDFPVVASGNFVGVLRRVDLIKALTSHGLQARVGDIAQRACPTVSEYDMLYRVFQTMQENDCPIVPVVRAGQIVGLVTLENIGELLMIRSALRQLPRDVPAAAKLASGVPIV